MNFFNDNNVQGSRNAILGDRGSLAFSDLLVFRMLLLEIGTRVHDLVSTAFSGILAIFTSQLLVIDSSLDSKTMDLKGFRKRKLRKPPDKTNKSKTTMSLTHANNLIFRVVCNNNQQLLPENLNSKQPIISKFKSNTLLFWPY